MKILNGKQLWELHLTDLTNSEMLELRAALGARPYDNVATLLIKISEQVAAQSKQAPAGSPALPDAVD